MSSDSEDDCYGNVAQQLQTMKNNYLEDKIETTNLLEDSYENDSTELDTIVKNNQKVQELAKNDDSNSSEYLPDVSAALTPENPMRRTTRSRAKKKSSENSNLSPSLELPAKRSRKLKNETNVLNSPSTSNAQNEVQLQVPVETNQRGRGRGRGGGSSTQKVEVESPNLPVVANQRGRGRGRGRTPRGRKRRGYWGWRNMAIMADFFAALRPMNVDASIPMYSVGNTEEYNDQSDSQALFSNQSQTKKTDDIIVVDQDVSLEENEELSVKVYWQSSEFFKFSIRKYQKISQIFDYFAKKENVEQDKLFLTFNDRILKPDDTPDSIGYSIVKFIDGGIVKQSIEQLVKKDDPLTSGMKLKFQCQNVRKPFELSIRPDDKLSVAMLKCAEHLEMPLDRLRFEFDGDLIPGRATATDLELEGGECIDVKILS